MCRPVTHFLGLGPTYGKCIIAPTLAIIYLT